jgi:hypothetical protein
MGLAGGVLQGVERKRELLGWGREEGIALEWGK